MVDSQTVLILGGGVGGVATARALRKRLQRPHRVVLVDREPDHGFATVAPVAHGRPPHG